jgi:hypothetical protein
MKLYDMLDVTRYDNKVLIMAEDKYDNKHFIFKGEVNEARRDEDVWDYLQDKVDGYDVYKNVIVITVKTKDRWSNGERYDYEKRTIDKWLGEADE